MMVVDDSVDEDNDTILIIFLGFQYEYNDDWCHVLSAQCH